MKDETRDRLRDLLWGLPASLILHALIVALLVYDLPRTPRPSQEEHAVNVSLVPPPDQPKPKPAPVPSPREAKAEKPPERKVEKPPEQNVEKPPPPEKQPRKPSPIEVLKPVFRFGDKDTGPRKSLNGGSAQDNSPPRARDDDSKPSVVPKDAEDKFAAPADSEEQADATKDAEPAQDVEKQETQEAAHDANKQTAAAPTAPAADVSNGEVELPASVEAPKPRPANASKPGSARRPGSTDVAAATSQGISGLPGVRKLYSQGATGDALATTSMAGVPRDKRAAKLCASALQQQLLEASYSPDLIPLVLLKAGNVLDVPEAAFHTGTTWYGLSFRCEVDTDATRVLSFDFRVGTAIPREEWARLGLPVRY